MKTITTDTRHIGNLELARLRSWLGFGVFAVGLLYWFADLASWLAPV